MFDGILNTPFIWKGVAICFPIAISKHSCFEAAIERRSVKKVSLKISQNSQESTCVRVSFLIKLQLY